MGRYIKYKVIRYPVSTDMLDGLGYKFWEIPQLDPSLFDAKQSKYMMLAPTYARYLDYVVSKKYVKDDREYGRVRTLLDSEKERFREYFAEFQYDLDMKDARVVEYVYCEDTIPPDYYCVDESDEFYEEIF